MQSGSTSAQETLLSSLSGLRCLGRNRLRGDILTDLRSVSSRKLTVKLRYAVSDRHQLMDILLSQQHAPRQDLVASLTGWQQTELRDKIASGNVGYPALN